VSECSPCLRTLQRKSPELWSRGGSPFFPNADGAWDARGALPWRSREGINIYNILLFILLHVVSFYQKITAKKYGKRD
jgi:hypothetical protein